MIGKKIIVFSVNPAKKLEKYKGILIRNHYLSFSWHSKRRKGALCQAFINEQITGNIKGRHMKKTDAFIDHVKKHFLDIFKISLDASIKGSIKGKRLIGECQNYTDRVVSYSAKDKSNETTMHDNIHASLCYPEEPYIQDSTFTLV